MADKTLAELKQDVSAAYATYLAELKASGPVWEQKPAAAGEGEEAWCARQVAEHIASANLYFANGIARIVGAEGPAIQQPQLPSVDEAVVATEAAQAGFMGVVNGLSDDQLAIEIEHPRFGKQTPGGMVAMVAYHLGDHANQLRTLRG
ncbi:MAG: DinB family protein [Dehalococcoidia bacterium]|nr:DinB family protein [Dehalococcoidia bacterium]